MGKTIGGMAKYLKQLLPVNIPNIYTINTRFRNISNEEDIRDGVLAFRDFLFKLCDYLTIEKSLYDVPIKGNKKFSDEVTLSVEFPFLNNIRSILINIGHYGELSEKEDSLIINGWDALSLKRSLNKNSTTKISVPQMIKSMQVLTDCGIEIDCMNSNIKKNELCKLETIKISFPDNPKLLTGWKALGVAQNEFSTRKHDDILLRCDYRMLNQEPAELNSILHDFIYSLSPQLQEVVTTSHKHFLDSAMECHVESGFFCTYFNYTYKRKLLWRFSTSFHNGYCIIVKTKNTSKYLDVIDRFPDYLKKKILKGYGCDRKNGSGHGNCQKGCEGFRFALNDSLLTISQDLKLWLDSEIASMQKKSKVTK